MQVPDRHSTPDPGAALPAAEPVDRLDELRARVLAFGAGVLDDAECLELLCELAEPDAPALLAAFGSAPEVVGAPAADLARTAGVAAACRIKVAQELADRLLTRPLRRRSVLSSWSAVVAHLRTVMVGGPRESFRVLFLDKRNRLISVHDGAGVRRRVERDLQLLQPDEPLSSRVGRRSPERQIARRPVAGALEGLALRVVGGRREQAVGAADLGGLRADPAEGGEVALGGGLVRGGIRQHPTYCRIREQGGEAVDAGGAVESVVQPPGFGDLRLQLIKLAQLGLRLLQELSISGGIVDDLLRLSAAACEAQDDG